MRLTDRDMDNLALAAQEREAERELVDAVLAVYQRGKTLPFWVSIRCTRLAAIKAKRAALLNGGGGRG